MKVRIDKSAFEAAIDPDRQLELSFLLHVILYKHRYELKLTDDEIIGYESFKRLMQSEQRIIEEQIAYNIFSSASSDVDCEVKFGGETERNRKVFSPSEAITYLLQPLSVILENAYNDSHFMTAIFRLFNPSGELMRQVQEGWIRFENAGGCSNVKNFLLARRGYDGEQQKFLRCYVLLDGDRRFPTDTEPNIRYKKLTEQLTEWGVSYHVLEKRCMENYLPDEAMTSLKNNATESWIDAYMALSPEQKDFISIAEGFRTDISKDEKRVVREKESKLLTKDLNKRKKSYVRGFLPIKEQSFYTSVSSGNFLHLESGLKIVNFKTQYPQKFADEVYVYRTNMQSRTSHQNDPHELEHIADSICALL